MRSLTDAFIKSATNVPKELVIEKIKEIYSTAGYKLSEKEISTIAEAVMTDKVPELRNPKWRFWKKIPNIEFKESDYDEILRRMERFSEKGIPEALSALAAEMPPKILATLKRNWPKHHKYLMGLESGFESRLEDRWGRGLSLLRMMLVMSREYCEFIFEEVPENTKTPHLVGTLVRLYTSACQTASEIVCLLSHGYADGAMARWRTLHEIAVIAATIERHGESIAERYLDHQFVEDEKHARRYQEKVERLGYEPYSDEELAAIKSAVEDVVAKYGRSFKGDYGWAEGFVPKSGTGSLQFSEIEASQKLDHLRPHYMLANSKIHAGSRGQHMKLGLMNNRNVLLSGASNAGLADPAHCTALSLLRISAAILNVSTNLDHTIGLKLLTMISDEIGEEFLKSDDQMRKEETERVARN